MTDQRRKELKLLGEDWHRRQTGANQPGAVVLELMMYVDDLRATVEDLRKPQVIQPERE